MLRVLWTEAVADDRPDEPVATAWSVDGLARRTDQRLHVRELDVAANSARLLGLFEKLTYCVPHFCEQSRHGFLNIERLLAERVHQILVALAVLDQLRKQLEEGRLRVIACDQAAGFLNQILH